MVGVIQKNTKKIQKVQSVSAGCQLNAGSGSGSGSGSLFYIF